MTATTTPRTARVPANCTQCRYCPMVIANHMLDANGACTRKSCVANRTATPTVQAPAPVATPTASVPAPTATVKVPVQTADQAAALESFRSAMVPTWTSTAALNADPSTDHFRCTGCGDVLQTQELHPVSGYCGMCQESDSRCDCCEEHSDNLDANDYCPECAMEARYIAEVFVAPTATPVPSTESEAPTATVLPSSERLPCQVKLTRTVSWWHLADGIDQYAIEQDLIQCVADGIPVAEYLALLASYGVGEDASYDTSKEFITDAGLTVEPTGPGEFAIITDAHYAALEAALGIAATPAPTAPIATNTIAPETTMTATTTYSRPSTSYPKCLGCGVQCQPDMLAEGFCRKSGCQKKAAKYQADTAVSQCDMDDAAEGMAHEVAIRANKALVAASQPVPATPTAAATPADQAAAANEAAQYGRAASNIGRALEALDAAGVRESNGDRYRMVLDLQRIMAVCLAIAKPTVTSPSAPVVTPAPVATPAPVVPIVPTVTTERLIGLVRTMRLETANAALAPTAAAMSKRLGVSRDSITSSILNDTFATLLAEVKPAAVATPKTATVAAQMVAASTPASQPVAPKPATKPVATATTDKLVKVQAALGNTANCTMNDWMVLVALVGGLNLPAEAKKCGRTMREALTVWAAEQTKPVDTVAPNAPVAPTATNGKCKATTKKGGSRCKRTAGANGYCANADHQAQFRAIGQPVTPKEATVPVAKKPLVLVNQATGLVASEAELVAALAAIRAAK